MWNPASKQGNKGGQIDPTSDTYAKIADVVDKAYYGGIPDPTGGATHYYSRQAAEAVAARLVQCAAESEGWQSGLRRRRGRARAATGSRRSTRWQLTTIARF